MSDTTDDMEAWSGFDDYIEYVEVEKFLNRIASCRRENFTSDEHMINYMKKIARLALQEIE